MPSRFEPAPAHQLVELIGLEPSLRLDVRYATADNFVGRAVYPAARAYLQHPVAEALIRVHRKLGERDLGLLVFDGYRPWSVTKIFWDETPPEKRRFVADPEVGSVHNRGAAVDLSLFDRRTGSPVTMPSGFDEMTERAHIHYAGGEAPALQMRDLLWRAMETEGFAGYEYEWWHFNHRDWASYALMDLSFAELAGRPVASL